MLKSNVLMSLDSYISEIHPKQLMVLISLLFNIIKLHVIIIYYETLIIRYHIINLHLFQDI